MSIGVFHIYFRYWIGIEKLNVHKENFRLNIYVNIIP